MADARHPEGELGRAEFAALMGTLGPLPAPPRLAVAVSGGSDSLALTLLLADWCAARGGQLLALTVDHGLRPEAAAEARDLACRLAALAIDCRVLTWRGGAALRGRGKATQAPAREARYALLEQACRAAGLLHLVTAHQADDQRETLLLRLAAGSGPLGLAAMPAVTARPDLLLLRPLLGIPRQRLRRTLEARGQDWVEDPSNRDPRHRRIALRQALPALAGQGFPAERLDELTGLFGRLRQALAPWAADLFARAVAWHPAGFAWLDGPALIAAPPALARMVLGEALRAIGGQAHPPGTAALQALLSRLSSSAARGHTLGGCRLLRTRRGWLAVREAGKPEPLLLRPGAAIWDGRFVLRVPRSAAGLLLRPLGQAAWQRLGLAPAPLPGPALWSLPSLWDEQGPRAVPALDWVRPGAADCAVEARFAPVPPAGSFCFTVACGERHII